MGHRLKTVVIGGSGSLGTVVCRHLFRQGHDLVFTYHRGREKAVALSEELRPKEARDQVIRELKLDLMNLDQVRIAVREADHLLNGIDNLVVTAGIATGTTGEVEQKVLTFQEITPEIYDTMMSVNVRGVFFAVQEAARLMIPRQKGRIVIVGSIDGIKLLPSPVDYACSKAALWGMTQALAKELGKHGILINLVAPGILEGGIARLLSPELMSEYLKHSCLKRVGTFDEIAGVIAFLASEKNTYLTGRAVILDGGL